MTTLQTDIADSNLHRLANRFETETVVTAPARTAVYQCLVVSASQSRREQLADSACDAGWDTIVCADASSAMNEMRRSVVQMALIDLEGYGSDTPDGFRELCEHAASQNNVLLAVCGHEGEALEEIWARQLGAWLYLPGVEINDDFSALCGQGLEVAAKLAEPHKPANRRSARLAA